MERAITRPKVVYSLSPAHSETYVKAGALGRISGEEGTVPDQSVVLCPRGNG